MGNPLSGISPQDFCDLSGTASRPLIFDVRREAAFAEATDLVPTAKWRDHRQADVWAYDLPAGRPVVVYCVHGHQVSQCAAAVLRAHGVSARYLEGGIEAYRDSGGPIVRKADLPHSAWDRPSLWVTRERPEIDRIACAWFVRRFIDRDAVLAFVSPDWVEDAAAELDATPFGVPGTAFATDGELSSFDAFLARFAIADPALARLAEIVRGADTGRLDLAPQAAGLRAIWSGLSAIESDDHARLEKGFLICDALYGWCRAAAGEWHGLPPGAKQPAGAHR